MAMTECFSGPRGLPMPWAVITTSTPLLTEYGWLPAGAAEDRWPIFGSDRHGELVPQRVQRGSARDGETGFVVFESSDAMFASDTRLLAGGGMAIPIDKIVRDGIVADVAFETGVRLPESLEHRESPFWRCLRSHAAFSTE